MLDTKQQKSIEKKNKEIEDAVLASQAMEHDGFKVIKKKISELEKKFRFQDLLGVQDDALKDQKGMVLGIIQVQELFKDIKTLAEKPRRDPITGEPEKMREE